MKKIKFALLIIMFLMPVLLTGCNELAPSLPNEYDQENTEVAYLKVFPVSTILSVNQTKQFEVKVYNSDNNLILPNLSKIKWICAYECIACGATCNLSSKQGSLQTTFSADRTGKYELWAKYEGTETIWAKAIVQVN